MVRSGGLEICVRVLVVVCVRACVRMCARVMILVGWMDGSERAAISQTMQYISAGPGNTTYFSNPPRPELHFVRVVQGMKSKTPQPGRNAPVVLRRRAASVVVSS